MRIIEVELVVESQRLENCCLSTRLHLFYTYLVMAWGGLCGEISKIKVSPVYGGEDSDEPDMEAK